jgi:hypothetical protein
MVEEMNQSITHHKTDQKRLGFLLGSFLNLEEGGDMFLRNVSSLLNGLHGVIAQTMEFFITTAVRTSHPSKLKPF